MITLNLQDVDSGIGLGSQQVSELPNVGGTVTILNGTTLVPFEVLSIGPEYAKPQGTFPSVAHWAICRRKV